MGHTVKGIAGFVSRPEEERFWEHVHKEPDGGCWLWMGALTAAAPNGYGRFMRGDGTTTTAHRVSFEWLVGEIPEGLELDHLCRVRRCVNPQHLEPVTHRENVLRGVSIVADFARQTSCVWGHEFDRLSPTGRRICSICDAERGVRYRQRKFPVPARACPVCDTPIDSGRQRSAVYCSHACQNRAFRRRKKAGR